MALAGNTTFSQSKAATISGVISGVTNNGLGSTITLNNTVGAASAANALTLTGTNTFAGNWIVNSTGGGANYANIDLILNNTASTTAAPTILGNLQIGANGNVTGVQMSAANQFSANSIVSFGGTGNYQYFVMHFGQTIGGLNASSAGNSVVEIGGPNDAANPNYGAQTLMLGGSGTYSFNGLIRDHDTGGGTNAGDVLALVMNGTGTQTLTGVNNYSGGTTVNSGTLIATNNGNDLGTGGLTVASGGTFDYNTTAAGKILTLGGGVLKMTGGGTIGVGLGGTISSTAAANLTGTNTINIYSVPGVAPTTGTQTLLSDTAGGLNGGTLNLGTLYNTSNFTVTPGSLTRTANTVTIGVTSQTALTSEYWKGGFSGGSNVWAISDGSTTSNWASNQAGTVTSLTPGSTATVTFSSTGATNQGSTVLGANMSILGLVFNDSSAVGLSADGNILTIGTGGITDNAGTGAVTLGAAMTLSGAQTWNNLNTTAANPLTVSGNVNAGGNALSIAGTNTATVGTGSTVLSGTDTLGSLTVSSGNLVIGTGAAITSSGGWIVGNSVTAGGARTGAVTTGTVIQNGGTVTINGTNNSNLGVTAGLLLGYGPSGSNAAGNFNSTGIYTLNGGTLNLGTNTLGLSGGDQNTGGAWTSTGTFNQNGGTVITSSVSVGQGYGNAATGNYNLSGGTLTTGGISIVGGGNPGSNLNFNFNGGTLQATGAFGFGPTASKVNYSSSVGANGGTIDTNGFAITWNSPLTHAGTPATDGGLTINSTTAGGALTLTAANTYTGASVIGSGATLNLGNGTTGNDGSLATSGVNDNGTLAYNDVANQSPVYAIGGSGSLAKSGAGTLTLTKAETYSGATTVNSGTLDVGSGGSLSTNALSVGSGATFSLASGAIGSLALNNAASGATALTLINSILNFDVQGNTADSLTLGSGLLASVSGSNTINLTNLTGGINGNGGNPITLISAPGGGLNGGTFTLGAASQALNGYNLTLVDTGTLLQLLETPNAYTHIYWQGANGPSWSTVTGGKTNFTSDAAGTAFTSTIPTAADNIIFTANMAANFANTTLDQAYTVNSLTFSGTGTSNTAGSGIAPGTGGAASTLTINAVGDGYNPAGNGINVQAGSGANTISAHVILGRAQTFTNSSANALALSGSVTAGSNLLTLAGSGATTISSLSTSTGATINSGAGAVTISAVTLGGASTFTNGSASALALGSVSAGANLLTLAGSGTTTIANLSTGAGATVSSGAAAETVSAATLTGASTFTNSSANTLTLNNVTAGANALTIAGTGATALTGTDALAQVTANTGSLIVGTGTAITSSGGWFVGNAANGNVTQNGGSVTINGTAASTFVSGGLVLAAATTGFAGATGNYTLNNGTLGLGNNALVLGDAPDHNSPTTGTFTQNGGTATIGTISLGRNYGGTLVGTYNLNGGTLQANGFSNTDGNTAATMNFNFNGGILQARQALAFTPTTGTTQTTYNSSIGANGGTIDTNGFAVTWNAPLTHAGTPATDGGLTVNSSGAGGSLTLSTANTYTGTTAVTSGTLAVTNTTGSGTGTGAVTVASGATLTGTGTVGGTVSDSGTINAGTVGTIGTLTTGALTFNNGSTLGFDLNASTTDLLSSTGALAASPGVSVVGNALATPTAAQYILATFSGGLGATPLSDFTLSGISGYTLAFSGNSLVLNMIPTTTATTYTLSATAAASNLRQGSTTGITSTITNTGTGTADTLNYTGLGASSTPGPTTGAATNGGPLAQGASASNTGLTFTASTVGANTITPTVTTATNGTLGGAATLTGTTPASLNVYSGQESYVGATGGNYVNGSNATVQSQWNQGGAPGIDAGFTGQDTATITGGKSVVLNASPNLAALTLGAGSSLTAGGGTLTLSGTNAGGTATVTATGTGNTISAPVSLATATTLSTASSGDTVTVSGNVTGTGSLTKTGAGTLTLTVTDSATGTTTVSAGTLALDNTGGAALTSSALTISGTGAQVASASNGVVVVQASNQLGTAGTTSNALPSVTLSGGTLADANGSSLGTSSGESPTGQAGVVATSFGAGVLTLAAGTNSYLDFGTGTTPEVLAFSGVSGTGNLYILNYKDGNFNGTFTPASGGGIDQLFFGGSGQTAQELLNVFFVNPTGAGGVTYNQTYAARLLTTGEVVAPEPSEWVSLLVGALGLSGLAVKARRRKAGETHQETEAAA